jgi:uncharacterized repeat protein (TIGR01451 family)
VRTVKPFVLAAVVTFLLSPLASAQSADLLTEKSGPPEVAAGNDASYTVTITNLGPDAATNVTLSDPIPAGMTFVSATQNTGPAFSCSDPGVGNNGTVTCTSASLAAGASADFTFVFNIPGSTPAGTSFTNVATGTSSTFDENDENNNGIAGTSTPPPPSADLLAQKFGPSAAAPDTNVTYTITIANNGPSAASNLQWSDTLPGTLTFVSLTQVSGPPMSCTTPSVGAGGTVQCTLASMNAGITATFDLVVHVPSDTVAGTTFDNSVTVSSDTTDPDSDNNTGAHSFAVQSADLSVDKSGPATALAGDQLTYTITVTNNGPDFTALTLGDPLPPDTTFVSWQFGTGTALSCSTPSPGGTGSITCSGALASGQFSTYQLTIDTGNTTSVTNTVTVAGDAFDPNTGNDSDSVTTTLTPSADLAIVKSGPATISAGSNISYTITVTNNGVSDAANVSMTDTLPANTTFVSNTQNSGPAFNCVNPPAGGTGAITCTLATMTAGTTATFTVVLNVASAASAGALSNTAAVTATTTDPDSSNNSSTANATISVSADVRVAKSGPTGTAPGTNMSYTVVVANDGPSDAASVTLTDILPPEVTFVSNTQNSGPTFNCVNPAAGTNGTITCTIATLVAGASANFTFVVQVAPATPFGGTITNTASVTSATTDPNGSNNSSSTTANVTAVADLRVVKTGESVIHAGETTTYTITVTNDGPTDAQTVTLSDTLPPDTTFVAFEQTSGPAFNCVTPAVGATGTVTCTIATLANATSASFTLTVAVDADATGTITNTATVTSANDPTPGNNSGSAAVAIAAENIPTLSTWALILLAAALGLIVVLKR